MNLKQSVLKKLLNIVKLTANFVFRYCKSDFFEKMYAKYYVAE